MSIWNLVGTAVGVFVLVIIAGFTAIALKSIYKELRK